MNSADISGLSVNEQTVLYNLVRHPLLSDQELCNRIDMKQSTFSTIKKKLRTEGYFYSSHSPVFNRLGSELLVVWYVTLNRKTRTEDRLAISRGRLLAASDIFTIVSESNQAVFLSVSKNIGEHVKVTDDLVQLYEENDFLEEIHQVMFPFDASSIFSCFDFAPLLNRIFQIEPEDAITEDIDVSSEKNKTKVHYPELNDLEKRVFLGLVKYPELSDSSLSERIGCSRPVFTRVKNRFLEERLIERRRIVSLEKLGFKMLALTHSKFNPLIPLSGRQKCVQHTRAVQTPIFNIARDPESVMLTAFRDFEEFKYLHNEYVSYCQEHNTLRNDPFVLLQSIPRIYEVKWLVYEPLVRKILDNI